MLTGSNFPPSFLLPLIELRRSLSLTKLNPPILNKYLRFIQGLLTITLVSGPAPQRPLLIFTDWTFSLFLNFHKRPDQVTTLFQITQKWLLYVQVATYKSLSRFVCRSDFLSSEAQGVFVKSIRDYFIRFIYFIRYKNQAVACNICRHILSNWYFLTRCSFVPETNLQLLTENNTLLYILLSWKAAGFQLLSDGYLGY